MAKFAARESRPAKLLEAKWPAEEWPVEKL